VILNLCKFRTSVANQFVISINDGPMRAEIEATGVSVYTERDEKKIIRLLQIADLINVHWLLFQENLYKLIRASGRPFVTTLHWQSVLPDLPGMTICVSDTAYTIQKEKHRFVKITNGIDIEKFSSQPKLPGENLVLTRICRPAKCAGYFWLAMNHILATADVELWIVGQKGKSTKRIKFWGIRRDVPQILWQTDIFVYTPRPEEGAQDLVVMESMAAGVPCVVSDVEAVRVSITHMQNGILVPFGDAKAFAEAVLLLVRDEALRAELGANAMYTARSHFDVRKKVHQYEKLYQLVIEKTKGRAELSISDATEVGARLERAT